MRHNLPKMAVALMLLWPGIATATTLDSAVGTADCNGWTADVQITFSLQVFLAHLETAVVLTDADGAEIERFDSSGFLETAPGQTVTFSYSGQWAAALDGQYGVTATFKLADIVPDAANESSASFTVSFGCGETEAPSVPVCIRTRGWWVRHLQEWPVTGLTLGGVAFGQARLVDLMKGGMSGDVTLLMVRQLIPAKLNLANGADDSIGEVVADADVYLAKYGLQSRPARRDRQAGIKLAIRLLWYNLQGCPDAAKACEPSDEDLDLLQALEKDFVEPQTFGAVKSMFR